GRVAARGMARREGPDGGSSSAAAAGAEPALRPPQDRQGARVSERAGHVVIVGAGPGSADLITMRGARRLVEADLVLYDALASEELRALAPAARWFFVGKRACRQSISQ